MRKRWIAAASIILIMGSMMTSMAAEDKIQEEGESQQSSVSDWQWQEDSSGWKYVNAAGEFKKNRWEEIHGYWYYFDNEGYMVSDWTRIGGMNYCFSETGELQLGWCYSEDEEKWHYYNEDGTAQKGWYQEKDGSWYWFSTKGEMASSGYKNVAGKRYYFFDNGQMAANQYVGLFYMDENGHRNKEFDISIDGKKTSSSVSSEVKDAFTEATKNIPRDWIRKFHDQGWEIIYYPGKRYFSAPMTENGIYYVCYKLDTNYKKIKICQAEELTAAIGEYIGYASGCYGSTSQDATDLLMSRDSVEDFVYIPDYFSDDMRFYFGKLVAAYVGSSYTRGEMEEEAPRVTEILKRILYT
ncbi:N-acetylmuramoyl-L-alanine amidase family protein [Lacrimispora sp.]|uniref:N-acetylmuramoyl-L-alanine amidase family protein n=1 Tax=Lacrimispora sp. TaxID=2719234 RepID=UPI00289DE4AD|nr:cell wall-binding protein [Lacrimispora sp.]